MMQLFQNGLGDTARLHVARDAIVALNGARHQGRALAVNEARPQEDRGGGGGRGGYGGGGRGGYGGGGRRY